MVVDLYEDVIHKEDEQTFLVKYRTAGEIVTEKATTANWNLSLAIILITACHPMMLNNAFLVVSCTE